MATSAEQPKAAEGSAPAPTQDKTPQQVQNEASKSQQPQPPSADAPKKLSGAELKAQKQAEKAKRRAAAIAAKQAGDAPAPEAGVARQSRGEAQDSEKGGKQKGKQEQSKSLNVPGPSRSGGAARRPSTTGQRPAIVVPDKPKEVVDVRDQIPECFSHLPMAKRIPISQADKDVHPAILALGQQMATFELSDNMARLEATLFALKKVIETYETPAGAQFARHFVPHVLNPQVEYLTECRPMCFSMGNAIRLLKTRITQIDLDESDVEAIKSLSESIESFVQERIRYAETIIVRNAAGLISEGDHVLTYGGSRLVGKAIQKAWSAGKRFEVAIIDDVYNQTGRGLAKTLRQQGLRVYYYPHLGSTTSYVEHASQVLLGAEAMFANGSLYAPAGTSDLAIAACAQGKPVIALCETINFDRERVATDSMTYNEIDPERCSADSFRLLFDTTRDRYVSLVITEYEDENGHSPSQAVLSILRKQEDPN